MQRYTILWADDEIEFLKPHILFLQNKGYDITPVNSGADALEKCREENYDIVFLDENMPGISGLETLSQIKAMKPNLPVVMITKSEEEHIMEEAIGSKIADYLIKPLNSSQILLSVKKILDNKRLITEKTNLGYQQDFRNISMAFGDDLGFEEWADVYKKLVFWELELGTTENSMGEVLDMQKSEANTNFTRFIQNNYEDWLNDPKIEKPLLSHHLMKKKVFPLIDQNEPVFFFLIDNLRYDQWKMLETIISEYFNILEESTYYSILPTTTAFARNAIFSGLTPAEMEKNHPDLWVNDNDEEEGKNNHEDEFLRKQLQRNRMDFKFSYNKILNIGQGKNLVDNLNNLLNTPFNVIVYNFVDMLSHARTDMQMIRELAPDESAYRSITLSWFQHSPLLEMLRKLAGKKVKIIITTDHGTVRVKRPFKIVGDKNTNTNLRYKQGKNLGFDDEDDVVVVRKPERFFLPKINVSTAYVFATADYFFAYPNNYNYYVNYYKDTFQHGGVSLEEMIIPFIRLQPK
jgi:CheY-like chemotaxis protein